MIIAGKMGFSSHNPPQRNECLPVKNGEIGEKVQILVDFAGKYLIY